MARLLTQANGMEDRDRFLLARTLGVRLPLDPLVRARIWAECRNNPDFYIFNMVRTVDTNDDEAPVKQMPDLWYLRETLHHIHTNPRVAIPKTRKMLISWLVCAYLTWYARFWQHRDVIVQSKEDKSTADFIFIKDWPNARCSQIELYLPSFLRTEVEGATNRLFYTRTKSQIRGFPQGGNVFRQHAPSLVMMDECCFMRNFKDGFEGLRPALGKGTRAILISSIYPQTHFVEVVEGDNEDGVEVKRKGIQVHKTAGGITAVWVHYSSDPSKDWESGRPDAVQWLHNELETGYPGGIESGMESAAWRREMEMDTAAHGAKTVFPNWRDIERAAVIDPIKIEDHWTIYVGYDYGYGKPFAAVFIAFENDESCYLVDEIYGKQIPPQKQAELVTSHPLFPRAVKVLGDPSIWNPSQHSDVELPQAGKPHVYSIGDILKKRGLTVALGNNHPGVAIAFRDLLVGTLWADLTAPRYRIFRTCVKSIQELKHLQQRDKAGEYTADYAYEEIIPRRNHAWDAQKYVLMSQATKFKPRPRTGFPAGTMGAYKAEIQRLRKLRARRLA